MGLEGKVIFLGEIRIKEARIVGAEHDGAAGIRESSDGMCGEGGIEAKREVAAETDFKGHPRLRQLSCNVGRLDSSNTVANAVEAKRLDGLKHRLGRSVLAGVGSGTETLYPSDAKSFGEFAHLIPVLIAGQPEANDHVGLDRGSHAGSRDGGLWPEMADGGGD